jgi:hypothetical protein
VGENLYDIGEFPVYDQKRKATKNEFASIPRIAGPALWCLGD